MGNIIRKRIKEFNITLLLLFLINSFAFNLITINEISANTPDSYPEEITLDPDTTAPELYVNYQYTDGSEIVEETVNDNDVQIVISGSDPNISGQERSGIKGYRFNGTENQWDGSEIILSWDVTTLNSVSLSAYDLNGNESEIIEKSLSLTTQAPTGNVSIVSTHPVVDGLPEVFSESVTIEMNALSDTVVTEYRVVTNEDITGALWNEFAEAGTTVLQRIDLPKAEVDGQQTVFVQYRNDNNQVSEVYEIKYLSKTYSIQPELEVKSQSFLYGDKGHLDIKVKNTGRDIAYNTEITILLPDGFSYVDIYENSSEPTRQQEVRMTDVFETCTDISIDECKDYQLIEYQSIADLLPGESVTVGLETTAAGRDEGYELGDIISIPVRTTVYPRIDFANGFSSFNEIAAELVPFTIETGSSDQNDITEGNEVLVGDKTTNEISIETNPEVGLTDETELSIEYAIQDGIVYVEDSGRVLINGVDMTDEVQVLIDTVNGSDVLQWMLGVENGVTPGALIEILFDTEVVYADEEDLIADFVEHGDDITIDTEVNGSFGEEDDCDIETGLCETQPFSYSEEVENSVTALYYAVKKDMSHTPVAPGETVTMTISIIASEYYDLYDVLIEDVLPDGFAYIGNYTSPDDILLTLESSEGRDLDWRISSIPAGETISFTYEVITNENYDDTSKDTLTELLAGDGFSDYISVDALWSDITSETPRTGRGLESDSTHNKTDRVQITHGLVGEEGLVNELPVRVGDRVAVRTLVAFPDSVRTDDFSTKLFIPVGTRIIPESVSITDGFLITPLPFGFEVSHPVVETGEALEISYDLEVLDDDNLRIASVVRNLVRTEYENINGNKLTLRNESTLAVIEPELEVSKRVIGGYLAEGEVATVKTRIENTGTSTAFNVDITDQVPFRTNLVEGSVSVESSLGGVVDVSISEDTSNLILDTRDIEAREVITLTYDINVDSETEYGDVLSSEVIISEFRNRDVGSVLPFRSYPEEVFSYEWPASEALVSTSIFGRRDSDRLLPQDGLIEIGRNDEIELVFRTEVVGKAPVYNAEILVEYEDEAEGWEINLSHLPLMPPASGQVPSSSGEGLTEVDVLLPGERFDIVATVTSPRLIPFDLEFPVSISVIGYDALGNEIRVDGSYQTGRDYDTDDRTDTELVTKKLDNLEPYGEVSFYELEVSDHEESIFATNSDTVQVGFGAGDLESEVFAINHPALLASGIPPNGGEFLPLELSGEVKNLLGLEGDWYEWDGSFLSLQSELLEEGINTFTFEAVDIYGNIGEISGDIIYDIVSSDTGAVRFSTNEIDLSNQPYTATTDLYINFYGADALLDSDGNDLTSEEVSGVGYGSYCVYLPLDGERCLINELNQSEAGDWSEGVLMSELLVESIRFDASDLIDVNSLEDQEIAVKLLIQDFAGNESDILTDTITFTHDIPEVLINLNSGEQYTNNGLVDLGLEILKSKSEVRLIQFSENHPLLEGEGTWSEWIEYPEDGIEQYVLPEAWESGEKSLCVRVENEWGGVSEPACDDIILDFGKPEGEIKVLNPVVNSGTNSDFKINANDPVLDDGTFGSGLAQYRISEIGTNPILLEDPRTEWSDWIDCSSNCNNQGITYNFGADPIGIEYLFIQFIDKAGNQSGVVSAYTLFNPYKGSGNIVINNDDVFTENPILNLDLSVDLQSLNDANDIELEELTTPVLMRLYGGSELADTPAYEATEESYRTYAELFNIPAADLLTIDQLSRLVALKGGWTYWTEYSQILQWQLAKDTAIPGDSDGVSYGKKTLSVQYKLANGVETDIYNDSIVYAPVYGISYSDALSLDAEDGKYTLSTIPSELLSQDQFELEFNAKNFGSLTWPKSGENPIKITYRWEVAVNFEVEEGEIPLSNRGNAVVLPKNIAWNEETGDTTLLIDTPSIPGEYILEIDTIHEGITWFSSYGNKVPSYDVTISQNPDTDPIILGGGGAIEEDPENIGSFCYAGRQHSFRGLIRWIPRTPV